MRLILLALFLAACSPIPVQMQSQTSKQKQELTTTQDQDQSSSHQSEARQGTNSMPVIIICNMNSAAGANCITPKADGAMQKNLDRNLGK